MKLGFKTFFGLTIVVGGIAFVKYVVSQVKMLQGICVKNTSLEWQTPLFQALEDYVNGNEIIVEIPLSLTFSNKSDLEVDIKDVNFDMYFQDIKIADVYNVGESVLLPNSQSNINLKVELLQFSNDELANIGIKIAQILVGGKEALYQIGGDIKVQASIYERLTIPYFMSVKGSEVIEDGTEDCK